MEKIGNNKLNLTGFKEIAISEAEFNALKKSGTLVYDHAGLDKFRLSLFKGLKGLNEKEQKERVIAVQAEFNKLEKKIVVMNDGSEKEVFITKAMVDDSSDTGEGSVMEVEDKNEIHLEDEQFSVLESIYNEEEIDFQNEGVQNIIEFLLSENLIENSTEEDKQFEVTDAGKAIVESSDVGDLDNDGDGDIDSKDDDIEEEDGDEEDDDDDDLDLDDDDDDDDDDNDDSDDLDDDDDDDGDGDIDLDDINMDDDDEPSERTDQSTEDLSSHAQKTSTEDLQAFIQNSNDEELKKIALLELKRREEGGDAEDPETKEEFEQFIDEHFSSHDKEDLIEYVIQLIDQIPGKKKEMKEHFRNSFPGKNNGNSIVGKIDPEQFKEFLEEYYEALTFEDLKKQAVHLAKSNPKAFRELKKMHMDNKELEL